MQSKSSHNPIKFQFKILDDREGIAVHVVEHDHEGRPVENGQAKRLTGGGSFTGELGGGNYFRIEAE